MCKFYFGEGVRKEKTINIRSLWMGPAPRDENIMNEGGLSQTVEEVVEDIGDTEAFPNQSLTTVATSTSKENKNSNNTRKMRPISRILTAIFMLIRHW